MKHLKTYEKLDPEYSIYKVGNYIIWSDDDSWEICQIVSHIEFNYIRIEDLYYLKKGKLKYSGGSKSNIYLPSNEERYPIKYISNNLEDCKEKIKILATINKYNI